MLHNLKKSAVFWTSSFGANAENKSGKFVFQRTIVNYTNGLIKCWQCGNHNSTAGIQFKCTKCQSLLELPDDVVNKKSEIVFVAYIDGSGLVFFLFRTIFNCWGLTRDLILILKRWQINFGRFKMYYIRINLAIGMVNGDFFVVIRHPILFF